MRNEKTEMAVEIYCRQNDMEFMEKSGISVEWKMLH